MSKYMLMFMLIPIILVEVIFRPLVHPNIPLLLLARDLFLLVYTINDILELVQPPIVLQVSETGLHLSALVGCSFMHPLIVCDLCNVMMATCRGRPAGLLHHGMLWQIVAVMITRRSSFHI